MNVVTDSKNNNSINIIQIADITRPRGDTMFVFERWRQKTWRRWTVVTPTFLGGYKKYLGDNTLLYLGDNTLLYLRGIGTNPKLNVCVTSSFGRLWQEGNSPFPIRSQETEVDDLPADMANKIVWCQIVHDTSATATRWWWW